MTASRSSALALGTAVASALAFGTSGVFVKPLLEAGWSPAAAVAARVLIAGAVLTIPALVALRGRLSPLWASKWRVLAYATLAVAGTQVLYFAAIQRIPVSMALLIEYLAPVGLVALAWARTRHVPRAVVLVGSVASIAGLALVIGPIDGSVDPIGVLYAALAAVGLGAYFVLGAQPDQGLPPIALAASSLLLGGLLILAVAATGILPFSVYFGDVALLDSMVPWFVPLLVVALVATAFAYVTGIVAAGKLGSRVASFLGLLEVVFASTLAWILLGEALGPVQLLGAALILAGVVLVRSERPKPEVSASAPTEPAVLTN